MNISRGRALWLGSVLFLALPLLMLAAVAYSETGFYSLSDAMRAVFTELGLAAPLPHHDILKLRLLRALCAVGVGGTLGLAGAMTQGLFRNPLAEPGLLGIGSGATAGAVVGIAFIGGYGPQWAADNLSVSLGIVPLFALGGALSAAVAIHRLASSGGRISVPALLLTGLAVNSLLGALVASLQVLLLQDWQVSRAIVAWGFGTLDERAGFQVAVVWGGALLALGAIPFIGLELDLLAGGEDDAAALGANPARIKTIVLLCVAIGTAASVSCCGQIAFVGLLIPHVMRMLAGTHHRALLPLSFLAGAALLISVVVMQHALCPLIGGWFLQAEAHTLARAFSRITVLQPGVLTALLGAPFFLYLLLRQGRQMRLW